MNSIHEVKDGLYSVFVINAKGCESLDGVHHEHLAVEQIYDYMIYDKICYGIISTFDVFVFMKREMARILYMSRLIVNISISFTIILYFFSHICVPAEIDSNNIAINLTEAERIVFLILNIVRGNDVKKRNVKYHSREMMMIIIRLERRHVSSRRCSVKDKWRVCG